jgi:hypothetical protein
VALKDNAGQGPVQATLWRTKALKRSKKKKKKKLKPRAMLARHKPAIAKLHAAVSSTPRDAAIHGAGTRDEAT